MSAASSCEETGEWFGFDVLAAQVDEDLGNVDLDRARVVAGSAQARSVGQGAVLFDFYAGHQR